MRGFGHEVLMGKPQFVEGSPQFRGGQGERELLERDDLLAKCRMQRELDVVSDCRVAVFLEWTFDGDVLPKAPSLQRVVGDDFDERSQCATGGFFRSSA